MKLSALSPFLGAAALSLALAVAAQPAGAQPKEPRKRRPPADKADKGGKAGKPAKPPGWKPTSPPKATTSQPVEAAPARYDFEKRPGGVDEALTVLLDRRKSVLPNEEEAGQRMAAAASARQVVQSNAQAAAATVIAELEKLSSADVEGHAELFSLLGEVAGQDAAVEYWSRKVSSGTPRRPQPTGDRKKLKEADEPRINKSEHEDPEVLIRYLAIAHLYKAARAGSERARAAVLEAAASPHREVRVSAVQYTYALTRRRWKARQELEKRLPRTDQYLIYRY